MDAASRLAGRACLQQPGCTPHLWMFDRRPSGVSSVSGKTSRPAASCSPAGTKKAARQATWGPQKTVNSLYRSGISSSVTPNPVLPQPAAARIGHSRRQQDTANMQVSPSSSACSCTLSSTLSVCHAAASSVGTVASGALSSTTPLLWQHAVLHVLLTARFCQDRPRGNAKGDPAGS